MRRRSNAFAASLIALSRLITSSLSGSFSAHVLRTYAARSDSGRAHASPAICLILVH